MTAAVAVVDVVPAFRKGLIAALGGVGLRASEPDDVEDWLGKKANRVVVITVDAGTGAEQLGQVRVLRPDVVMLALLRDPSETVYISALNAGAAAALARDASPSLIALAVQAIVQNYSVVPVSILSSLTAMAMPATGLGELEDAEIDWLRRLAEGTTVTAMAESVGYSEREMHRLLRKVYRKLNVPSRTAAIIKAARQGILN